MRYSNPTFGTDQVTSDIIEGEKEKRINPHRLLRWPKEHWREKAMNDDKQICS